MKRIVVTGFMGSGKSRFARESARRLDLPMIDLDDAITQREGKSPAQLINEDGEPHFRAIESRVLHDLLKNGTTGIISLGGGAWIEETNRKLIDEHDCLSVWLDAPFQVCWSRIEASAEDRPLGKTRAQALALYERRRPIYQLATLHLKVLGDNIPELISQLENVIRTDKYRR